MHNVVILLSYYYFNKNQNNCYYNLSLEKFSCQLAQKIMITIFFNNIIMPKFAKTKVTKKLIKICDVGVYNILSHN